MRDVVEAKAFQRDMKLMRKRGKDMRKMTEVVRMLATGTPLPARYVPHPLKGKWKPLWDCHIEPDWLFAV